MEKQINKNSKIFQNKFLELLTWTSFPLHLFWYSLIILTFFVLGLKIGNIPFTSGLAFYIGGVALWSLVEYLMHRFLFHFISENPNLKRLTYIFHGIHHEYPLEERRTMMPPVPGLLISSAFLGILFLIAGNYGFFLAAGLSTGYLAYSGLHYSIHIFKAPKFLQPLWTHHLVHHYQQPEKAFGVSSRVWDRVFGTMPEVKNRSKK